MRVGAPLSLPTSQPSDAVLSVISRASPAARSACIRLSTTLSLLLPLRSAAAAPPSLVPPLSHRVGVVVRVRVRARLRLRLRVGVRVRVRARVRSRPLTPLYRAGCS